MKILFLGYSDLVRRRVLPALAAMPEISGVAIASHSRAGGVRFPDGLAGEIFTDYEEALARRPAGLVYVSTINRDHARWVEQALRHGYHTIVDKPAFLSLERTEQLLELASSRGRCLAEANVYPYHPQIERIRQIFARGEDRVSHITATFSFPPLPPDNYRYRRALGGGALWDLGPYAITPGRLFFNGEPERITAAITRHEREVESGFSLLATYEGGRALVGHFGFNTGYRNRLELLGARTVVGVDRPFTTPDDLENRIDVNQNNRQETITVGAAGSFAHFLRAVIDAIHREDYNRFATALLSDARTLHRLRAAAATLSETWDL